MKNKQSKNKKGSVINVKYVLIYILLYFFFTVNEAHFSVSKSYANTYSYIASSSVAGDEILIDILSQMHAMHRIMAVSPLSKNSIFSNVSEGEKFSYLSC